MQCPEEVALSREDGEALRQRLAGDTLTAADRRVLDQVLQWYFWLLFASQEATFSLKRLRILVFGEKCSKTQTSPPGVSSDASGGASAGTVARGSGTGAPCPASWARISAVSSALSVASCCESSLRDFRVPWLVAKARMASTTQAAMS